MAAETLYCAGWDHGVTVDEMTVVVGKYASWPGGEAGDKLIVRKLPQGCKIVDAYICTADRDTSTSPTHVMSLEVTNGTTTKTIIDGTTVGQTGGIIRPTKAPGTEDGIGYVVPDAGYYLRVITDTAAATEAAGIIIVSVTLTRLLQPGEAG
jgi:hypothetical protein